MWDFSFDATRLIVWGSAYDRKFSKVNWTSIGELYRHFGGRRGILLTEVFLFCKVLRW